ncbi:hypothetical protein J9303_08715 [Bacillaceae bacterium Marseille-Q3522]|nr:hypothetical protein [Bacillaceae bacterium Marseille-Q3522]
MKKRRAKKVMIILLSCIGALLFIAFASLLMASGLFQKQTYLEPWQKNYAEKFSDPRIRLVAHGLLAGNGHNMQPWRIQLDKSDPMVFYLYADSDRLTNEVDPVARQFLVTQGAFLEYVRIAGKKLGYETAIELFSKGSYDEENLPESMKTKPVAKVTLTESEPENNPLYDFIFLQDTNRSAYEATKLTSEQIRQLQSLNNDEDISVEIFQDQENLDILGEYAMESATIEANTDRVMEESAKIFRANEYQKNKYRYGYSVEGQGTGGFMRHILQGLVTLFPAMNSGSAAKDAFIQSTKASVDSTPAYVMIITKDNSRLSQVKSGMLYSRMVLEAQHLGLVMQPLSQALEEYPEMNGPYTGIHNDYAKDGGTIQMLLRIGEPTMEAPKSMRRDVMELIDNR